MGFLIFLLIFSFSAVAYHVEVVGSYVFRQRVIQEKIKSRIGNKEPDERQLEQIRYQIMASYRRLGFSQTQVSWKDMNSDGLVCEIEEGPQVIVRNIQVLGSQQFSDRFLENKIKEFAQEEAPKEDVLNYKNQEIQSILNPSIKSDLEQNPIFLAKGFLPFDKSLFLKAKESLEDFYLSQGFLEVQIFGPKESEIRNKHWVDLQFRIQEGIQTRISEIKLLGAESQVEKPVIHVGDPMNLNQVEEQRIQLEESFWNQGYPDAQIRSELQGTKVIYYINLHERIRIEEINLIGNEVTLAEVILGRLQFKKGDWFSLEKITESRSQILQTDLFSEVDISQEGNRLIIYVKERERNTLELGIGASLEDGPRVTGIWQYRNILGRGISFRTRVQLNYPAVFYSLPVFYPKSVSEALKSQTSDYLAGRFSAGFFYPNMPWVPFNLDSSIDLSAERALKPAYILNRVSILPSLFSQITRNLRITPQIELEYSDFNCPTCKVGQPNLPRKLDQGAVKQMTPRLLMLLDQRDNTFLPNKGFAVELDADFGFGFLGIKSIAYNKLLLAFSSHLPLLNNLTWVFNGKVGGIWNLVSDAYVPLFKRFYLGGTNSIRGFSDDQIFAVDSEQNTLVSLGGNYMFLARNEIRFPISGDWQGGIFVDTGELLQELNHFSVSKLALGSGFGVRYNTPIGPLMVDLGIRIFDGDRVQGLSLLDRLGLHFSIGNSI